MSKKMNSSIKSIEISLFYRKSGQRMEKSPKQSVHHKKIFEEIVISFDGSNLPPISISIIKTSLDKNTHFSHYKAFDYRSHIFQ